MIMPTKIIKPVDSLLSISASVIKIIDKKPMAIDDLHEKLNISYVKTISIDKLLLCVNFLYIINKIEKENEIITLKI